MQEYAGYPDASKGRAEEAMLDRIKNKWKTKMFLLEEGRRKLPINTMGLNLCQFNGGEGFNYSTFYTSSVICSYDCLSSSVCAGLGRWRWRWRGGETWRVLWDLLWSLLLLCCSWLAGPGWVGRPALLPALAARPGAQRELLPAKWWIAGHSTLQPPTLTGTKNILKSKIFKLIYRQ